MKNFLTGLTYFAGFHTLHVKMLITFMYFTLENNLLSLIQSF